MNEPEVGRYLAYCGVRSSHPRKAPGKRSWPSQRYAAAVILLTALLVVAAAGGAQHSGSSRVQEASTPAMSAAAEEPGLSWSVTDDLLTPAMEETLTPIEREMKVFTYLFCMLVYAVGSGLGVT